MTLAIIKTGGKQYLVKQGDKLNIEKLNAKPGETVKFNTLLITDENGEGVEIGKPTVKSKVEAKVLKHDRADKILVAKYKAKVRYFKRVGHRQAYTQVQIQKI